MVESYIGSRTATHQAYMSQRTPGMDVRGQLPRSSPHAAVRGLKRTMRSDKYDGNHKRQRVVVAAKDLLGTRSGAFARLRNTIEDTFDELDVVEFVIGKCKGVGELGYARMLEKKYFSK